MFYLIESTANFQAANIENASSQENSEFAHQLTTLTLSEEEWANFTSDKQQQCTHCGNQPDHQPRTPKYPAFLKTCSQCGTLHHFGRVCMKRTTNPGHVRSGCWVQSNLKPFNNKLRHLISSNTVLVHFDPSLPTQVRHDACKIGISGALTQKHPDGSIRPVAYASRSLSPVEQRYSQTKQEALSRVWACERFYFYIHGSQFDLVGDHKPLGVLLNGHGNLSPRIKSWQLQLQNDSPRIVYQPGIQNAVDFLSRKPVTTNTPRDPVEEYANSIIVDSLLSAVTLQELLLTSERDPTLKTIKETLHTGKWSAAPKPFADLNDELCQKRRIILRNNSIVIPDALHPCILQLATRAVKASLRLNSISDKE